MTKRTVKHAYLISVYKNPEQVCRLVSTLNADNVSFVLHIDKNFDDRPFKERLKKLGDKIQYVEREKVYWGGFGIVKATVNGIKMIHQAGDYDYVHFITAQGYPIKPPDKINDFFVKNYGKSFLQYFSLYDNNKINRIRNYYIGKKREQKEIQKKLLGYFNRFTHKTGMFERKHPAELEPYGGEGVWSFHKSAVQYILEYLENNPKYLNFHKYSFAPDEIIFQTILLNTSDEQLRKNLVNNLLCYIDWTKPRPAYSPATFRTEDFEDIKNSDKLFARKFDAEYDSKILDLIDEKLLGK